MVDGQKKELSWSAYALDGRELPHFWQGERFYSRFKPNSYIVDVGCGDGWVLADLQSRGHRGIGTEVTEELVALTRARGCEAAVAPAEKLPVESGAADAVVFSGVLPFTDEDKAFAEIARILKPGGPLEASYLGIGFALRDLFLAPTLAKRYYGLRSLVNSIGVALFGRKLPGKYGDTAYVTPGRIAKLYERHGFVLREHAPSPKFLGFPVFIYHSVDRVGTPAAEARPTAAVGAAQARPARTPVGAAHSDTRPIG